MQKREFILLAAVLSLLLALSACSGGSPPLNSTPEASAQQAPEESYEDIGEYDVNLPAADNAVVTERKIIRNASLDIQADNASQLYKSIVLYGTELGGYEDSYDTSNDETFSTINAVLKIPPEKLGIFVDFIRENAEVINSSMNSQDISESYFDMEIRLETKRRSVERYYELLAAAANIEEIVYIQRIIDEITEEIESYEGRLRAWDSQSNMAAVNLYIRQDNASALTQKEIHWNALSFSDMGYLIKTSFITVTNLVVSVLQWIVIIIVGYLPVWIILAASVFLWIKLRRKRKAKQGSTIK